jgi:hypothetical protein
MRIAAIPEWSNVVCAKLIKASENGEIPWKAIRDTETSVNGAFRADLAEGIVIDIRCYPHNLLVKLGTLNRSVKLECDHDLSAQLLGFARVIHEIDEKKKDCEIIDKVRKVIFKDME